MSGKIFKKYKYDISLEDGVGARLVAWVTGLMIFFMTLMLAVNMGLSAIANNWVAGLMGSLTVELRPADGDANALQEKILALAKKHPAVAESRALTKDEIRALIEPWLGEKMAADLPLPVLIDIKLKPRADTTKLQSDILELAPKAVIDSHQDTLDDVKTLINAIRAFVLLLTAAVTLIAVAAISGIVRAKLAVHQQEVETLHLLGAGDEYIARQFRQHTLSGTFKGALAGVGCMAVTLIGLGWIAGTVDKSMLPPLELGAARWAFLIAAPVLMGAMAAHLAAQATVMKALARLP